MRTYALKKSPGVPLYESLYRAIRADILSGALAPGEKLPSKRAMAVNLDVSKITVEAAYGQLLAEGYLRSVEKVGYFVEQTERLPLPPQLPLPETAAPPAPAPETDTGRFPFSVWSRLQREVMLDYGGRLLQSLPPEGVPELRRAIAAHLRDFRGMRVSPEQIVVGAGTDFLCNLLIQLLGREKVYGVEEPGYGKIWKIYRSGGVRCLAIPMDGRGVMPDRLEGVQVLHISPSHHFPTGLVTHMPRRQALLAWASGGADRWIVEDDYDSEFRFDAHPMPAMASLDGGRRVIYMNSFSRSLAPSLRIGYMVLPPELMARFHSSLGFYGSTVASFELYTLARFLKRGYFEKHINRMRKFYRGRRNRILARLERSPLAGRLTVLEQDAGLHFLVKVDTRLTDRELEALCARAGLPLRCLSAFYREGVPEQDRRCLVVRYGELSEQALEKSLEILEKAPAESCLFPRPPV